MLRLWTSLELINDVEIGGVNYIDFVSADLGHIHPLQSSADGRTEMPCPSFTIEIAQINNRGHTRHCLNRAGRLYYQRRSPPMAPKAP